MPKITKASTSIFIPYVNGEKLANFTQALPTGTQGKVAQIVESASEGRLEAFKQQFNSCTWDAIADYNMIVLVFAPIVLLCRHTYLEPEADDVEECNKLLSKIFPKKFIHFKDLCTALGSADGSLIEQIIRSYLGTAYLDILGKATNGKYKGPKNTFLDRLKAINPEDDKLLTLIQERLIGKFLVNSGFDSSIKEHVKKGTTLLQKKLGLLTIGEDKRVALPSSSPGFPSIPSRGAARQKKYQSLVQKYMRKEPSISPPPDVASRLENQQDEEMKSLLKLNRDLLTEDQFVSSEKQKLDEERKKLTKKLDAWSEIQNAGNPVGSSVAVDSSDNKPLKKDEEEKSFIEKFSDEFIEELPEKKEEKFIRTRDVSWNDTINLQSNKERRVRSARFSSPKSDAERFNDRIDLLMKPSERMKKPKVKDWEESNIETIHNKFRGTEKLVFRGSDITETGCFSFLASSLKEIEFLCGGSLKEISEYAFTNCTKLQRVSIPRNVNLIEIEAFCGCKGLEYVVIKSDEVKLEEGAFEGCTSLRSLTVPVKITLSGKKVFSGCTNLRREKIKVMSPDGKKLNPENNQEAKNVIDSILESAKS